MKPWTSSRVPSFVGQNGAATPASIHVPSISAWSVFLYGFVMSGRFACVRLVESSWSLLRFGARVMTTSSTSTNAGVPPTSHGGFSRCCCRPPRRWGWKRPPASVAPCWAFSAVPRISGIVVRTGLHLVCIDQETRAVMGAKRPTRSPAFGLVVQPERREEQIPRQRTNRFPIAARASKRVRLPRAKRHVQRDRQASFPARTVPSPRTTTLSATIRLLLPPAAVGRPKMPAARRAASRRALVALDRRNDAAVSGDPRIPGSEGALQLVELEPALGQAHRLAGVEADPVLVPRDVPGDRDHELAVHAGERQDARPRLAEALRDPADSAAKWARVEDIRGLD